MIKWAKQIWFLFALVSGIIGFMIGMNVNGNSDKKSNLVSMKNEEKNLVGT